jgi:hypothetical protein
MPQKNKSLKVILILPLVLIFGLCITGPVLAYSTMTTLATSSVGQYLFGGDASGASYSNPGSIIAGNGDHILPNFPCIQTQESGQCGTASVANILTFLNHKQYSANDFWNHGNPDLLGSLTRNTNIPWVKIPWDFNRIKKSIDAGFPVIIYTTYKGEDTEHIMAIFGYRNNGDLVMDNAFYGKGGNYCRIEQDSTSELLQRPGYPNANQMMIINSSVK